MFHGKALVAVLLLTGCSSIFGSDCEEETRVVEVGGPFAETGQRTLERYRESGWDCRSDGGDRYVCTGCPEDLG